MTHQRPRPSRRALRAAWVMARAFTPHRLWAVLVLPWTLLAVLPATVRGGLFLDATRTGMVLLAPINPVIDLLVVIPVVVVTAGIILALLVAADFQSVITVLLVLAALQVIVSMAGMLFLVPRQGASAVPYGPETPKGPRWEFAGLAQLPGTRFTALHTARRVLAAIPPPGAVVVATANTPAQFRQYQRFGFTGGAKRRVHRVIA